MTAPLAMPWADGQGLYSSPGRLVLKLPLGEMPEWIPTARDVRTGAHPPATRIGSRRIDRVLQHFGEDVRATRVHGAAASRHQFGSRHCKYDDLEQVFGLSRTLRVDLGKGAAVSDAIDALRQLADVERVSAHYLTLQQFAAPAMAEPDTDPWMAHDMVRAADALAYEPGDSAVIIAIVDTGIALTHRELEGRLRAGFDTVQLGNHDVAAGVTLIGDETDEDPEPDDEVGHGTACAGIIGARGDEIPPGLAGDCRILPMRVLGAARMPGKDKPVGIGALTDIDDGVKRAIDLGAKVLNMSFGTAVADLDPHDPWPHADVVKYGLAHGCVMIAASGNTGRSARFLPACIDGVIAVGAVGENGYPSAFTTTGDHVTLSAPGERVKSVGIEGYQFVTGTSFAAPFVAAAAALLVSRANRRSAPLDGHDVLRILRETARPFPGSDGGGHGAGILDVVAALRQLDHEIDVSRGAKPRDGVGAGAGDREQRRDHG